jgi:hypothetical protein
MPSIPIRNALPATPEYFKKIPSAHLCRA